MLKIKPSFMFCIVGTVAVFSLTSCSSSSPEGRSAWSKATGDFYLGLEEVDTLKSAKPPVLRSPAYEAKLGKPKVRMTAGGDYELNYANPAQPFDRLAIQAISRPFPKLNKVPKVSAEKEINGKLTGVMIPQKFRTVTIEGQQVRWFQESTAGGADGAYYTTEGFSLKDIFGNIGYYRLVMEGGGSGGSEVAKRFASVKLSN